MTTLETRSACVSWAIGRHSYEGRIARAVASEQVSCWKRYGDVSIADVMTALGYHVGRKRHTGRTWEDVEMILAREWWDLKRWNIEREAA